MLIAIIKFFGLGSNPQPELVFKPKYNALKGKRYRSPAKRFKTATKVTTRPFFKRGIM